MMRSLYSGVAGLKVHQTKMDVIGNNIANVNTVGYKSQNVTFTDVFYQTVQSASGPNAETGKGGTNAKQVGIGAALGTISTNITKQGGTQSTENPFDLMINGDEFFIISDGQTNYFSKAGNFNVDEAGNLVNGSGYTVMGWMANDDGTITQGRVTALKVMSEDQMSAQPAKTTAARVIGNINQQDDAYGTDVDSLNQYVPYTVQFYDSQGYLYSATYHVKQESDGANGTAYRFCLYNIVDQSGEIISQSEELTATDGKKSYAYLNADDEPVITFNNTTNTMTNGGKGDPYEVAPGQILAVNRKTASTTYTGTFTDKLTISPALLEKGVDKDGNKVTTWPSALENQEIEIDYSTLTNYGSSSTIDSKRGDSNELNGGKSAGTLQSLSIDQSGKVIGSYSNGDIITLAQIAVTSFSNAAGLEKVGNNLYAATANSGSFNGIGKDITANGDSFTTGVLEMSNVDLSTEFTEMITTQRGFQANSRIITTSDSMLEELINLKR